MSNIEAFVKAAAQGDLETMIGMLAESPELIRERMPNGLSPLTAAMYYGRQAVVLWLLERPGLQVTVHEVAMLGDDAVLANILDQQADIISERSFDGWTPLHLAAFFGGTDAAKLLIERGADVNAKSANPSANMPLHAAVAARHADIVQLLLESGVDVNAVQSGGWTALHQAADNGDLGMVQLLLENGADVSAARDDGATARSIAEQKGYQEIAALLH
jgi:ankyrin repeat protein